MPLKRDKVNITFPEEYQSREYKIFKEEELVSSLPRTIYEKACRAAAKLNIHADAKSEKKLAEAIEFSHLKAAPVGVASLTILAALLVTMPTLALIAMNLFFSGGITFGNGMIILVLALPFLYYIYTYPMHLKKRYEMSVGSEIVTMILYVAMFMRNTPNLERAISFTAENITGPLAYELRKLMWDVEVGNYFSIEDALVNYTKKWSQNRNFVQSIEIIISSLAQPDERREQMLGEVVGVILEGNREDAKHFTQSLKTPVMVVHAMGIILPVLGLVMFPLIAVFLGIGSSALFFVYDILLPIVLMFLISNILESRPSTFSRLDIADIPDAPPKGKFRAGKKFLPAWPFGFFVASISLALGYFIYAFEGPQGVLSPLIMIGGITLGFAVNYLLLTFQLTGLRDKTREIENEFAEALFQIGSQIHTGTPLEVSLEYTIRRTKNLKIKDLFLRAMTNIKSMGMTFRQAFFDKSYGAVLFYPSRLVKSVMKTVIESADRGAKTASLTMISVSQYLKGIHATQEQINDELSDPVSSMKFQLFFLSPMISGVVITLTVIIIGILSQLTSKTSALPIGSFIPLLGEIKITPFEFIIVVGIYLVENIFILSFFVNGIENGPDTIGRQNTTAYALIIGYTVFAITLFLTLSIFSPLTLLAVS